MVLLRRLRRRSFGLRGRIVGVVVITTAVTLLVAAVALLPRLESSLRKAAKTTLKEDVQAATREGLIEQVKAVPYTYVTVPQPVSTRSLLPLSWQKQQAIDEKVDANNLQAAEQNLLGRLGATSVTLIGYIDAQGRGCPVIPEVPAAGGTVASGPECQASTPWPVEDVVKAFREHKTIYSFGTNEALAAIPLGNDSVLAVRKSIDEIPAAVAAVRRSFEIAVIPGMLLTLLLAIPLAATLVRRLRDLRQAALRLAVDGAGADFPVDRARDEVGDLARSFAIVQRRLRQQEEARRAFVATASHELRTPLASLQGMLELLAEDLRSEQVDIEDAAELLDRARAQSHRLSQLAADLLDLSRLDADVRLRSEPVELSEIGRAVLAEFELRALERGVIPVLDDAGGGIWALADPGSVARIIRILLDNALRVAPAGTVITVSVGTDPEPSLSVIDQGPGIAREERGLIFERFKRGRATGGEAGFGLGLAIGRELAERMGGALALADAHGPGAKFTLTLRPAQAPSPEPEHSAASV